MENSLFVEKAADLKNLYLLVVDMFFVDTAVEGIFVAGFVVKSMFVVAEDMFVAVENMFADTAVESVFVAENAVEDIIVPLPCPPCCSRDNTIFSLRPPCC